MMTLRVGGPVSGTMSVSISGLQRPLQEQYSIQPCSAPDINKWCWTVLRYLPEFTSKPLFHFKIILGEVNLRNSSFTIIYSVIKCFFTKFYYSIDRLDSFSYKMKLFVHIVRRWGKSVEAYIYIYIYMLLQSQWYHFSEMLSTFWILGSRRNFNASQFFDRPVH